MSFGIVRGDGSAKPVADALQRFAAERRSVRPPRSAAIDEAAFYRSLPESTAAAYARFVEERTGAAR